MTATRTTTGSENSLQRAIESGGVDRLNSHATCPVHIKGEWRQRSRAIIQELCESRGGRPGLSVLTSLLVSVDVKQY